MENTVYYCVRNTICLLLPTELPTRESTKDTWTGQILFLVLITFTQVLCPTAALLRLLTSYHSKK